MVQTVLYYAPPPVKHVDTQMVIVPVSIHYYIAEDCNVLYVPPHKYSVCVSMRTLKSNFRDKTVIHCKSVICLEKSKIIHI